MNIPGLFALASLGLVISGCGPSRESALAAVASHDDALRARASFDFQCPKDGLTVTPLKTYSNAFHEDVKYAVMAGVQGCNQRGTYLYDQTRGLWVLNSETERQTP